MRKKLITVTFDYSGYEITAKARVLVKYSFVNMLKLYFNDISESDYPTGRELEEIKEKATELIIEESFTPECVFT